MASVRLLATTIKLHRVRVSPQDQRPVYTCIIVMILCKFQVYTSEYILYLKSPPALKMGVRERVLFLVQNIITHIIMLPKMRNGKVGGMYHYYVIV